MSKYVQKNFPTQKTKQFSSWTWHCLCFFCYVLHAAYTNHIEWTKKWNLWKASTFITFNILIPSNLCSGTTFFFPRFKQLHARSQIPTGVCNHKRKWKIATHTKKETILRTHTHRVDNRITTVCLFTVCFGVYHNFSRSKTIMKFGQREKKVVFQCVSYIVWLLRVYFMWMWNMWDFFTGWQTHLRSQW